MSNPSDAPEVTPALLREWGLPDPGSSKNSRGRLIVVGGSKTSPGAVVLAGEARGEGLAHPPAADDQDVHPIAPGSYDRTGRSPMATALTAKQTSATSSV